MLKNFLKDHFDNQKYFTGFAIISFIVIFTSIFVPVFKSFLLIPYFTYTLFRIIKFYEKREGYKIDNTYEKRGMKLFFSFWVTSIYVLLSVEPSFLPILYPIVYSMFIYYIIRYLGNRILNNCWKYSLFLFLLPFTSGPIAFFFVLAFESLGPISNRLLITTTVLISLLIPILLCAIVDSKSLAEMKVSIYFWLAFITTFSTITFLLAPYIEQELYKMFPEDYLAEAGTIMAENDNTESKELLKIGVDYFLELALLPYVISVAWCCFVVELREKRNRSMAQK